MKFAIIGMDCKLPGKIESPREFLQFIKNKTSGITMIPEDRWNSSTFLGKIKKGGFVQDIDSFDNLFFSLSTKEAKQMDPQQCKLLEITYKILIKGYKTVA